MKYKLHVNKAVLPESSPLALPCKTGLQELLIITLLWLWWSSQWSLKVRYTGFMHKNVICWCLCHEEVIQGRQDRQRKEVSPKDSFAGEKQLQLEMCTAHLLLICIC